MKNTLLLAILLITGCNEQDVITDVRSLSGFGQLAVEITGPDKEPNSGTFGNITIESSNFIEIRLENLGGMKITKVHLKTPKPLFTQIKGRHCLG